MGNQRVALEIIEDFLAKKRIAMVGLSRQPMDFSVMLFEELCRRGYDVVPVNPGAAEVMGRPCFDRVQDIKPPVDGVLLMTLPTATEAVVEDCPEAGIRRVWMYSAGSQGAVSPKAVEFCQARGFRSCRGECPFMFFPHNGFHRVHGFIRKITASYPRRRHALAG